MNLLAIAFWDVWLLSNVEKLRGLLLNTSLDSSGWIGCRLILADYFFLVFLFYSLVQMVRMLSECHSSEQILIGILPSRRSRLIPSRTSRSTLARGDSSFAVTLRYLINLLLAPAQTTICFTRISFDTLISTGLPLFDPQDWTTVPTAQEPPKDCMDSPLPSYA